MASHDLILNQKLQLKLSPQLRQMVHLLQLSNTELDETIDEALQNNLLLEKTDTPESDNTPQITASISAGSRTGERMDDDVWENIIQEPDFFQQLHAQVYELSENNRQSQLLHILIDSLDEHGYLNGGVEEVIEYAPLEWQLNENEMQHALQVLQQFDPAGVGARNLQESMILQLERHKNNATTRCALRMVKDYFHLLEQQTITKWKQLLPPEEFENLPTAFKLIRSLNAYPDNGFANGTINVAIRPDVRVHQQEKQWIVSPEPHLQPRLVLREEYIEIAQENPALKEQLSEARTLIQNLQLRENTILNVARAIVHHQQDFFLFGEAALQPLNLADIAQELDLSISTVSRSVRQKYLICPSGLFELKYFFPDPSNEEDDAMSNTAIKAHIKTWIENEDKSKPLSDDALRAKLNAVGVDIARRTIAKYRDALQIPSAFQRKKRD